ncbi:MBL fold metallo-hydrolase [Bryobacter aggregatus]|uniref:MBL fold metallo-hydrolase n=1 Tax=Bryobacter aggregatus TaxID=360054 RepID=UPI00055F2399|nr:MBL fold metallo-hydrolase [Bryobacter aggregatus]
MSSSFRFLILASSSAGNSAYLTDGHTHLLVDCGLSRRETFLRLQNAGVDPDCIDAILISHEHSDHVTGLGAIAKKLKKPVYLTQATANSLEPGAEQQYFQPIAAGSLLQIGTFSVQSFSLPHDAVDPVGYVFQSEGRKVGVCTDLGYMPDSIRFHLQDCDLLLLESNHDLEMLKVGPYPWSLKQRVMSRRGHLSNDVVSQFILDDLTLRTRHLILGHLSEQNNVPALAHMVAAQAIERRGLGQLELTVAEPRKQSVTFEL